jgi:hypothetical protein
MCGNSRIEIITINQWQPSEGNRQSTNLAIIVMGMLLAMDNRVNEHTV